MGIGEDYALLTDVESVRSVAVAKWLGLHADDRVQFGRKAVPTVFDFGLESQGPNRFRREPVRVDTEGEAAGSSDAARSLTLGWNRTVDDARRYEHGQSRSERSTFDSRVHAWISEVRRARGEQRAVDGRLTLVGVRDRRAAECDDQVGGRESTTGDTDVIVGPARRLVGAGGHRRVDRGLNRGGRCAERDRGCDDWRLASGIERQRERTAGWVVRIANNVLHFVGRTVAGRGGRCRRRGQVWHRQGDGRLTLASTNYRRTREGDSQVASRQSRASDRDVASGVASDRSRSRINGSLHRGSRSAEGESGRRERDATTSVERQRIRCGSRWVRVVLKDVLDFGVQAIVSGRIVRVAEKIAEAFKLPYNRPTHTLVGVACIERLRVRKQVCKDFRHDYSKGWKADQMYPVQVADFSPFG